MDTRQDKVLESKKFIEKWSCLGIFFTIVATIIFHIVHYYVYIQNGNMMSEGLMMLIGIPLCIPMVTGLFALLAIDED